MADDMLEIIFWKNTFEFLVTGMWPRGLADEKFLLLQVMICNKPLPEPMMAYFTGTYMGHQALIGEHQLHLAYMLLIVNL